jgi:hypothetical protein
MSIPPTARRYELRGPNSPQMAEIYRAMKASDPHTYSVSIPSENIRVIGSNSLAVIATGKLSCETGVTLIDTLVGAEVVASIATPVDATPVAQGI